MNDFTNGTKHTLHDGRTIPNPLDKYITSRYRLKMHQREYEISGAPVKLEGMEGPVHCSRAL